MAAQSTCEKRRLGKRTGLNVSSLCLGAMTFGESQSELIKLPEQAGEEECHEICDKFVQMGGNFFDTANVYSGGRSEEILGSWLKKQEHREQFIIATKIRFPTDKAGAADPNGRGLSRHTILTEVEKCLQRLQTPYIDLLYTHCWDDNVPIEETLRTLNELVVSGKIHYIGVSNVTGWQLQKMVEICRHNNYHPIAALQAQYSLLCRETEWELREVCDREGIALLPWSPLKGGLLSGKVTREANTAPEGSRLNWVQENKARKLQSAPDVTEFNNDKTWDLIDAMAEIGKASGHSVAQVAIKWLLQQPAVDSVVIGAKRLSQLEDNMKAGAADWKLTSDELARLTALSAVPLPYPWEMVFRTNPKH